MQTIKVKLFPSKAQAEKLNQTFGACRWVYNYALERKTKEYNETKKSLSIFDISAELPKLKEKEETLWLKECPAQTLQQSLRNLDSAFTNFFKKRAKFPKFKSRHNKQSAHYPQGFKILIESKKIKLPKLGWLSFKDKFDFQKCVNFRSVTVSKDTDGNHYASILYDNKIKPKTKKKPDDNNTLGIDLGIKDFATLSNGQKIANPKHLDQYLKELERKNQRLARCKKGSKSREKAKISLAKTHKKISNTRKDFIHKTVNSLIESQDYDAFAIEDLSVQDMQEKGHRKLSQLIGDAGWRMFRDILTYKAEKAGKSVLTINRWCASSKTCSCGVKNNNLTLDKREWTCNNCGKTHDRDILAANNIKNFSLVGQSSVQTN